MSRFLVGADDCNGVHTPVGSGDVFGVPFVNGRTGVEGQNEALCYFFGLTGIDVWFEWTATATGVGTMTACNGTSVDTKTAVWPGTAGCPADGTSLACMDDSCGLQTDVSWPIRAGTNYTLQLGTFPGASGGLGPIQEPLILTNLVLESWQALQVDWSGDVSPQNKIDDRIDSKGTLTTARGARALRSVP